MKKIIALAPMAGITDACFRAICKEQKADLTFSEMVSAASLFFNHNTKNPSCQMMTSFPQDKPFFVQLFGSVPQHFASATKKISALPAIFNPQENLPILQRPTGIDINFGCPAKKVLKQNSGCVLMKQPKLAREIILAVLKNTDLPVSLKIRAGIENFSALDFLQSIGDLNWQMLTVHGRTFSEKFSGEIDFELIKKIKALFPQKTILANGGIFSPEKAQEVLEKTNADGVMLARGVLGRLWLFSQTKEFLATGKYSEPTQKEIQKIILRHAKLFFANPKNNPAEFRKHLLWYCKGWPDAKKLREEIVKIESLEKIEELLGY